MSKLERISFIGCGKVGRTLARALKNAGYSIGALVCKTPESGESALEFVGAGDIEEDPLGVLDSGSIHFITTNDDAIPMIVRDLDARGPDSLHGHYFFHTSGSLASTILEPLQKKGAEIASIHPLQVFADPQKALETLPGIYYAIEGGDKAMSLALQLVDKLHGKLLLIPTGRKVLYHIAGVFVANYLTVLVQLALNIMEDIGETPEEAYEAFLPLMVGALQNIEEFGVVGALTGPISRGDLATIQKHVSGLDQLRPEILAVYKLLGQEAVAIAVQGGKITPQKAKQLMGVLQ